MGGSCPHSHGADDDPTVRVIYYFNIIGFKLRNYWKKQKKK